MILHLRRVAFLSLLALAATGSIRADALSVPVPLLPADANRPASEIVLAEETATRALQLGFPSVANVVLEQLLTRHDLSAQTRNDLLIQRSAALLDLGRLADAEALLKQFSGAPTPSLRLHVALVAARGHHIDTVKSELGAFKADALPEAERGWYPFLQGVVAEAGNDFPRASSFYQQAVDQAGGAVQRARFVLAREQARMVLGEATDGQINAFRQTIEKFPGRDIAYRAVSNLAIALSAKGDRSGAINVLQSQLQGLPREQHAFADEWSLLLGLISGPAEGVGRNALRNLLSNGADRDKQRVALQLLARTSTESPRRDEYRAKLDELIAAPKPHPLLEELLLFRAQLALTDRNQGQSNLTRAEEDANQLLERFPGSQLKGLAYGILTDAAWERGQYRNAANLASKARESLPAGETRAQLGVLLAEAYFRGADFVSAANAYRAASSEVPEGVKPGDLIFQQVLSEIGALRLDQAAKLLDEQSKNPRFDPTNRWEAEWNLARELQGSGKISVAYDRMNRLLETPAEAASIPPELRARMRWLQARLSYDAGDFKRTFALTESLLSGLQDIEPSLRADIASTTMLLQVQANFAMNANAPSDKTTDLLKRLRAEYPTTDAAVYSYIVESDAAARKGRLVEAQGLLTELVTKYSESPYAPFALYEAAGYAEQRGQSASYHEANDLIERLVTTYPKSDLVFYARLRQGHLLRNLTEFARAQQVYEELDNNRQFAEHPGRAAAELALADTHAAQAANDPSHLEAAHRIYERLLDLPSAPIALRIEAGHKLGLSLARHGQPDKATRVWGSVINFLADARIDPQSFGAEGRYWLSRTLIEFADLLRRENKLEEAREAYDLILKSGLPGASIAQENIATIQPPLPR
ncbi:MAG TPA: hypothetical protein VFT72_02815 [Opitutaceae bacterium]|nr:hypothetical protein [Opitutaceae bacterium]